MTVTAKLFSLALTFLLLPAALQAQTPQEQHVRIIKAIEAGDRPTALAELRALQSANADLFRANNYDYLLARLSEQEGNAAAAAANYQSVATRKSVLATYALWHLAQLARSHGDLVLERERLRQFIITSPEGRLRDAALLRLGESYSESADYPSAASALQPLLGSTNVVVAREAQSLTGQALVRMGEVVRAREMFAKLLLQMPDASRPDDFALAAARGLDQTEPQNTPTSEPEHLLRASVYQFNRDFEGARNHYVAVVQQNPGNPTVPNALYQLGRGFYLQGRYQEALDYFDRVLKEFPDSTSARDALSYTAGSYNRMKRSEDAIGAYKRFIERFPDSPNPERTYLNIIDTLHEAGRYPEALNWVQQTRARFPNQLGATLALFAQMRIHLAQGLWAAVVTDADELKRAPDLGGNRVPSGTSTAEVVFLQAYALEQLGKFAEAIELYLSLPDGRNDYFGQRATDHLRLIAATPKGKPLIETREQQSRAAAKEALANREYDAARSFAKEALRLGSGEARKEALDIVKQAYQALPAYKLPALNLQPLGRQEVLSADRTRETNNQAVADELLFLGLYDEAIPAFTTAQTVGPKNNVSAAASQNPPAFSDVEFTLAVLAGRGGLANHAVRFGERLWKTLPADFVLELAPREYIELLYPLPYRESLLKHASPRGIDPRLVLSVARQESRYQADAKSVAAARGMMQFISETATEVAQQLGKRGFQQDELYNPDTAIQFGAQYLATLFRQFPNQTEAVAAAYNGGADNVARWMGRAHSKEPERYVAEIGFAQSKDYVFRVITNLRAYQTLYDSKLQRQ